METTTNPININTDKVNEMTARRVVEARTLLAEAKAEAEKAEEAFRALNTDAVILEDGTKVAIVEQNRRSIDQTEAREALSEGHHQRVSKRVVQQALVDEAVSAGWLKQAIVDKFQEPDSELRFFVGQPLTGGMGITLTAANTVIYYNNSYDLATRLQSEDRAHRISQTNKVTYIDLVSPGTIDEKILKALRGKINLAGQVLGEEARDWLV